MKTVSAKIALSCLRSGLLDHLDDEQLFRACGITRHEVLNPLGRIDAQRHLRFLKLLASLHNDFTLAPAPGLQQLFEDFLPVATVCTNAPTLREALQQFIRFRPLIGECDELNMTPHEQGLLLRYRSDSDEPYTQCASSCFNFLHLNTLITHYADGAASNLAITLEHPLLPAQRRRLAERFDCPVSRGAENSLLIADTLLDRPHAGFSPVLQGYQLAQAERSLFELHPITNLISQIRHLLQQRLLHNDPESLEIESVQTWLYDQLRLTRWSLLRRLQQEGLTFSSLYAQVRSEEACRLLRDSPASMLDISHQLGFVNQSSFTRFFKEHQQCTPRQYRQQRSGW